MSKLLKVHDSLYRHHSSTSLLHYHADEVTIEAQVFDSRGRSSNKIIRTIKVHEYYPPQLVFSTKRSGANNQTLTVVVTAKVAPLVVNGRQRNRFNLSFKSKISSDTNYPDKPATSVSTTEYSMLSSFSANLSGTYPSDKSYTVLGSLSDEFRAAESTDVVGTEQVVLSYHKDGIGVGKFKEQGALDVHGDIYGHNLKILKNNVYQEVQTHQVTLSDGRAVIISKNPDEIIYTGFYYLCNGPNRPYNRNGYLVVESFDPAKWIKQTYTDVYTGRILIRLRLDGRWNPWREVIYVDPKEATMTNASGYKGVSRVYRRGNSVTLQLNSSGKFRSTRSKIGSIPTEYVPNLSLIHI